MSLLEAGATFSRGKTRFHQVFHLGRLVVKTPSGVRHVPGCAEKPHRRPPDSAQPLFAGQQVIPAEGPRPPWGQRRRGPKSAPMAHIRSVDFLFDMLNTALRPAPNRGTFLAIRLSLLAGWVAGRGLKGLRSVTLSPAKSVGLSAGGSVLTRQIKWQII